MNIVSAIPYLGLFPWSFVFGLVAGKSYVVQSGKEETLVVAILAALLGMAAYVLVVAIFALIARPWTSSPFRQRLLIPSLAGMAVVAAVAVGYAAFA